MIKSIKKYRTQKSSLKYHLNYYSDFRVTFSNLYIYLLISHTIYVNFETAFRRNHNFKKYIIFTKLYIHMGISHICVNTDFSEEP